MPKLYGPKNMQFYMNPNADGTGWEPTSGNPVLTDAKTLGEAIAAYEKAFSAIITPYDGSLPGIPFAPGEAPKYFLLEYSDGMTRLVDIHIYRDESEICPKQDLSFPLEASDVLNFGPLTC